MPTDPRKDDPDDDRRKDFSILHLFVLGGRMVGGYTEDAAIRDFLKLHPEAREADVRAELTRELKARAEQRRQQKASIERERAQKAE